MEGREEVRWEGENKERERSEEEEGRKREEREKFTRRKKNKRKRKRWIAGFWMPQVSDCGWKSLVCSAAIGALLRSFPGHL